jgi:archaemetzincin
MNSNINILILNDINSSIIRFLKKRLPEIFDCHVTVSKHILIPSELFNYDKKKYDGKKVLKFTADNITLKEVKNINIGIFDRDMFSGNLDYTFGLASVFPKIGIVSTIRLHPHFNEEYFSRGFRKRKSGKFPLFVKRLSIREKNIYYERILKEISHVIGHTLELGHCDNKRCIMSPSDNVMDIDQKDIIFCDRCRNLIQTSLTAY